MEQFAWLVATVAKMRVTLKYIIMERGVEYVTAILIEEMLTLYVVSLATQMQPIIDAVQTMVAATIR